MSPKWSLILTQNEPNQSSFDERVWVVTIGDMTMTMNDSHMVSIAQVGEFIKVAKDIEFQAASRKEKYAWIETILSRFGYFRLRKKDKSTLRTYMLQMTGFSDAQLTRLIGKKKKLGRIIGSSTAKHKFQRKYTAEDVALLIETDKVHNRLSGPATKRILIREYAVFGKEAFKRLKDISIAHIYNLRGTRHYQSFAKFFTKTKPTSIPIGERRKPQPHGKPGYLRVDTVHQGDLDKEKGVYHVNIVDEVTQWEIIGAVEKISEYYLLPLLKDLLAQYPFRIIEFHSDNGSEYINYMVARLLNKLLIQQTKSRARQTNDNALVEGKNGAIIRKHMGYIHIPQKHAKAINTFYRNYMNIYLNYHRPCGFATVSTDRRGKQKKKYHIYQTPYEKFLALDKPIQYLKDGVILEKLDQIAQEKSDNEFAALMQKAKIELFKNFSK